MLVQRRHDAVLLGSSFSPRLPALWGLINSLVQLEIGFFPLCSSLLVVVLHFWIVTNGAAHNLKVFLKKTNEGYCKVFAKFLISVFA